MKIIDYLTNREAYIDITDDVIVDVLLRDKCKCRACKSDELLTLHHIIPRADGGLGEYDNLITLCKECHDKVELENLEYNEYAFSNLEKPKAIKSTKNKKNRISMYVWRDGKPLFAGYRYE